MLNIRTVILSVVLVVVLMITVQLVNARTEVASDPSSDPVIVLDNQEPSDDQYNVPIPSYRSSLDECFDVPLREAAECKDASQTITDTLSERDVRRCCGLPY